MVSLGDEMNQILAWDCLGRPMKFHIDADYGHGAKSPFSGKLTCQPSNEKHEKNSDKDLIFACDQDDLLSISF